MLKVEIADTHVSDKVVQSKGKTLHFFEQTAYAFILDEKGQPAKYPVKFTVPAEKTLPDGSRVANPYPVGMYVLSDSSITVDQYGRLECRRVALAKPSVAAAS